MKVFSVIGLLMSLIFVNNAALANNLDNSCRNSGFIENEGQFASSSEKIYFKLGGKQMSIFLTNEGLAYVFDNKADSTKYRMNMTFKGNPDFTDIETSNPSGCHINYYQEGNSFQRIQPYRTITVKNLYPGIHWKIYKDSKEKGLKYDFVIDPEVNPNKVKWQYSGADKITTEDNNLTLEMPLGSLKEGELLCYTKANGDKKRIDGQYRRTGNTFQLAFKQDRFHDTLVVDPPVDWATFFGGSGDEKGKAIRTDKKGNTYIGGRTKSTNLPTPSGSPVSNSGQYDVFISKFDTDGKQQWVSVLGGSSDDDLGNMRISQSGYIYFGGKTGSYNFPTKDGHQNSKSGREDGYVVKMNLKGGIIWSTYFGGSDREILSGLDISQSGDVYITGLTESYSGISTSGAFQRSSNSSWDGYLTKFDSSGSIDWSTYYGGDDLDNPKAVSTDDSGNVYLAGVTRSSTQMGTSGSYQPTYNGVQTSRNYNGFLGKFDAKGNRLWGTYFGKNGSCISTGVTAGKNGNVFLTGRGSGAPTKNAHQKVAKAGHEAYFSKFSSSGNLRFSTFYGGSSNEHYVNHAKMVADKKGRLIACGRTKSNDLPLKNPVQSSYGGNEDGFIVAYDSTGTMQFSTYWGGNKKDVLFNTALSPNGYLLFAGTSASNGFGVQSPSSTYYSQSSNNGGKDFYLLRLDPFCDVNARFTLQDSKSICAGDSVLVTDTSGYGKRKWSINGQPKDSTSQSRYFKFDSGGTYKIQIAVNQGGCSDKKEKTVWVRANPSKPQLSIDGKPYPKDSIFACKGDSLQVSDNQNQFNRAWQIGEELLDSTNQTVNVAADQSGITPIKLVHSNKGCADSVTKSLKVTSKPPKGFTLQDSKAICLGDSVLVTDTFGFNKRKWTVNGQIKDSTSKSRYLKFASSGTYTVEMAVRFGPCFDTSEKSVEVRANPSKPQLSIDGKPYPKDSIFACKGDSLQVSDNQNQFNRAWYMGGQLLDSNHQTFKIAAEKSGVSPLKLVHSNKGCVDSTTKLLDVTPVPPEPILKVIAENDTMPFKDGNFCANDEITFKAGNQKVLKREWLLKNEVKDSGSIFKRNFLEGPQQLTIRNYNQRCQVSEIFNFNVNPKPPKPSIRQFNEDTLMSTISGDHYQWFWNDSLLSLEQQLIKAPAKGEYRLVIDNGDCFSDTSAAYQFRPSAIQRKPLKNYEVYPNPSKGAFKVEMGLPTQKSVTIRLFSSEGKLLKTVSAKGNETVRFNRQASGLYWLKISNEKVVTTEKVVILKKE